MHFCTLALKWLFLLDKATFSSLSFDKAIISKSPSRLNNLRYLCQVINRVENFWWSYKLKWIVKSQSLVVDRLRVIGKKAPGLFTARGGGTPRKIGWGVVCSPLYDQNLWYSLSYIWPDQKFDTLLMTWTLHQNPVSDLRYNWIPGSDQC